MMPLTLAVSSLIGSVQYGFQAREFFYSLAGIEDWNLPPPAGRSLPALVARGCRPRITSGGSGGISRSGIV
ncbi:hypothetical protein [Streptomyces sp. NPDC054804]